MKNYLKNLKTKIRKSADPGFDNRFWKKFETEFNVRDEAPLWEKLREFLFGHMNVLVPVGAFALVLIIYVNIPTSLDQNEINQAQAFSEVLESREMLEHMDLMLEVDSSNLTEKEWKVLLEGKI